MLKSGRKKAKRIIDSIEHRKKVYEFQKKKFIFGQLVKFKPYAIKMVQEINEYHRHYTSRNRWSGMSDTKYTIRAVTNAIMVYPDQLSHNTLFKIRKVVHDDNKLDVKVLLEKFDNGKYVNVKYLDLAQKAKKRKLS